MKKLPHGFTLIRTLIRRNLVNVHGFTLIRTLIRRNLVNVHGFTLIELLLVIAIIGILATISFTAINPQRQLAKARDAQRKTDLYAVASAVYQFASEHSGDLPDTDGNPQTSNFPTAAACIGTTAPCYNLGVAGATEPIVPIYLAEMPKDPKTGTGQNTGYTVYKDANGRVVLQAIGEVETTIIVKK